MIIDVLRQPVCPTITNGEWFYKRREITLISHLSQSVIKSFVFHWLRAHTLLNVTCFPAVVRAMDLVLSLLLIC